MVAPEETAPHLFVVRIWTDPTVEPPGFSRGLIEDARTRDRHYFKTLEEMQGHMVRSLAVARRDEPGSEV